jgi:hypothetical protein
VNAALAASPWYCVALRHASAWLDGMASWLERAARREAVVAADEGDAELRALRIREEAEEQLREIRLRSLRYY